jgi:hypothetical protein
MSGFVFCTCFNGFESASGWHYEFVSDTLYSILILEFDYYMCLSLVPMCENNSQWIWGIPVVSFREFHMDTSLV